MSTNFGFLQTEWPQIYESAVKAESFPILDPGTSYSSHCHYGLSAHCSADSRSEM
jgi:hypothetical protein